MRGQKDGKEKEKAAENREDGWLDGDGIAE